MDAGGCLFLISQKDMLIVVWSTKLDMEPSIADTLLVWNPHYDFHWGYNLLTNLTGLKPPTNGHSGT